ncbi:dihydrodipicolinate synthase family protein [Polaromonas sp. C04]|uniref:dihydrodipicolinate synthase family protein n=1 Tax=Polaromonas sp. C04 TaxID=1945857 RepID=UPI00098629B0|nr:dihydrodipicolinate synthase family protein [Polaromonas sp. C04]OOG51193.1 dihydrodipicolinate synthase family protein [Polaromonas sp. C04]
MKTTPITKADLERSVIAVPPLARHGDLSLNKEANRLLIRHLEGGGVRSLMYGGNANFYHLPLSEYADIVDFLADAAGHDTWVLPSVGPDYGRMMDQARILKTRSFPTAMLLPITFPKTEEGLLAGIRRFTDALGKPAVMYIKSDNYIKAEHLGELRAEGRIASVKYAVVRENPAVDPYLEALIKYVGADIIVSGIGERPVIVHWRDFGITGFTSGSICVAPLGSMELLSLLKQGRYADAEALRARYIPLEDCRDEINPIRVLHDAVTLSGIAPMGPMLPFVTGLNNVERQRVEPVARKLLACDLELAEKLAA